MTFIGIDRLIEWTIVAERTTDGHNLKASFGAADARHLPFPDRTFDSTFCVAVLQHITDIGEALREFARVTCPGGRVLAVEPDNAARVLGQLVPGRHDGVCQKRARSSRPWPGVAARWWSRESGRGWRRCLPSRASSRSRSNRSRSRCRDSVRPMRRPGSHGGRRSRPCSLGPTTPRCRRPAANTLGALTDYEQSVRSAPAGFVELQSTLLFAVLGQRTGSHAK